ncbi:response regulator [Pedobacter sp. Leaf41]|jgi:DNA-binding NarL/FixJ family response regulator|uniref:response regulator n=1 Tax=Pedobacter sp. Leaf41 TaxID=1736218 RepID=UPI00138F5567|nr:response regulator [Pedobacter sp. Leaf41]
MKVGIKVLIADDSDLMRMVMKGFFKKFLDNPTIAETTNLPDTFELLNQTEFDFLLLDINMPREDSNPETIIKVHAIQPQIKVCMFTGNDKATLQQQYKDAGAIGFIQKHENMGISIEQVLKKAFD